MILMNLEAIIEWERPNKLTLLIYLIMGLLLVYFFVPKWNEKDNKSS